MYGSFDVSRGLKVIIKIFTVIFIAVWGIFTVLLSMYTASLYVSPERLSRLYAKENQRTVINEECKDTVALLKNIDSTVDMDFLCDENWNADDIMCSYFLRQNGFSNKNACRLLHDGLRVPKIVYYVVFSEDSINPPEFLFMHYLSMVSAKRTLQPWAIYFVSDIMPSGYWWKRVQTDIHGVRFIFRKQPNFADGNITYVQHKSDVVRLQILLTNGGIYLDTDVMIIKSLDPIRQYPLTMGLLDNATGMGNAVILAERKSPFIREWYRSYFRYKHTWNGNSLKIPHDMWLRNSDVIHMETEMFYRPNWYETKKLFHETGFNWYDKYVVHIWHRHGYVPREVNEINRLNTTLGEIFRFVYYGSKEMVKQ